jgi:hypothetical protein
MTINLNSPALKNLLLLLQHTWFVPSSALSLTLTNYRRRKSNLTRGEYVTLPFDLSQLEASLSRLIANLDQGDQSAFLREWAAFLSPRDHLSTAQNTQAGMQIMALVREEGKGVGLKDVQDAIVQLDVVKEVQVAEKAEYEAEEGHSQGRQAEEVRMETFPAFREETTAGDRNDAVDSNGERDGVKVEKPKDDEWDSGWGKPKVTGPAAEPKGGGEVGGMDEGI